MTNTSNNDYELLDSGNENKLERFGKYTLVRPCAAAVWKPSLPTAAWDEATARFGRDGGNTWTIRQPLPASWNATISGLIFRLSGTPFGHVGVFPEQQQCWGFIDKTLRQVKRGKRLSVLNLFAYSGGSTLAAARAGAEVCHLDASKGMVARARENAALNGLADAPIRWIVDDVTKFLNRELRRGIKYDAIILDPPSFGRGNSGEIFKIEAHLASTLDLCVKLLAANPLFVLLSCHTPAFTPTVLAHILRQGMNGFNGNIESGEMTLTGKSTVFAIPNGTYASWKTRD